MTTLTPPQLGSYAIDTSESTLTFRTRHLFGLAPVKGSFTITGGTVDVAEPAARSAIRAEIDAASFRTRNPLRDQTVRSARFLDTGRHPVITFSAGAAQGPALAATRPGSGGLTVPGTLTVRGTTRPVSLEVELLATGPGPVTARATARIDRTEFGVTALRGLAARYINVTLDIRCVRR